MSGFQDWYDTNKEDFNAKRRERYHKDKEYRDRVQSYTRRLRSGENRKILADGAVVIKQPNGEFVPCFRMGVTAQKCGVAPHVIRTLEKRGLIPMVGDIDQRHMRYYTENQITQIKRVIKATQDHRSSLITQNELNGVVNYAAKDWEP